MPTPHLDKLTSLLDNDKLPDSDKPRIEATIDRYRAWIRAMNQVEGSGFDVVDSMVYLFNEYKFYVDFDLIFKSPNDFLYRQKGQLKLDNSVIEEFLPILVLRVFPELNDFTMGPTKCFASMYFQSSIREESAGGRLSVKSKDQDFAIARKLYLRTSHNSSFNEYEEKASYIGYIAAECKTNLDKTMFQEASATANDLKSAVKGSKYFLLCEWLDMAPTSTASTDIDEVLLLRKAKRLSSNVRKTFSTVQGRLVAENTYRQYLKQHPHYPDVFKRFLNHINEVLNDTEPIEKTVLEEGYF